MRAKLRPGGTIVMLSKKAKQMHVTCGGQEAMYTVKLRCTSLSLTNFEVGLANRFKLLDNHLIWGRNKGSTSGT
jgi:hypothetical protein